MPKNNKKPQAYNLIIAQRLLHILLHILGTYLLNAIFRMAAALSASNVLLLNLHTAPVEIRFDKDLFKNHEDSVLLFSKV